MARTQTIKNYNNLLRGLVTEGNEFVPPEGAFRDAQNLEVVRTGGVRRRLGISKEDTVTADKSIAAASGGTTWACDTWDWDQAAGDPDSNFTVVQIGMTLYFYKKGVTGNVLPNFTNSVTLTAKAGTPWAATAYQYPFQIASIRGFLYVVGKAIAPSIVKYYPGSGTFTLYAGAADIYVRDFEGTKNSLVDLANDDRAPAYTITFNTQTANFTVGATLHGATTSSNAVILGQIDNGATGTLYLRDPSTATNFSVGEIITDGSGGSATVASLVSIDRYREYITYNLLNKGWDQTKIEQYIGATGYWPMMSQVWTAGKNATGDFTPSVLDKIDFGSSPAPNGHFVLKETHKDRATASGLVSGTTISPADVLRVYNSEPSLVAAFAGRAVLGGIDEDDLHSKLYFSPIISSINDTDFTATPTNSQLHRYYQVNDPTAEYRNAVLADDGLVLNIPDMGRQIKFVVFQYGLAVICTNGIWVVTGGTVDSGFSADTFMVNKITDLGTFSAKSVVPISNPMNSGETNSSMSFIYWNDTGIYYVSMGAHPGTYTVQSISQESIKVYYKTLSAVAKNNAKGYFDQYNQIVYWLYQDDSSLTNGQYRDAVLVFDTVLKAFYYYKFSHVNATHSLDPTLIGFTQDRFLSTLSGPPVLKWVSVRHDVSGAHVYLSFNELRDTTFTDWPNWSSGTAFTTYLEPWADHLGDITRIKDDMYMFCYFKRTENGFVNNGSGGLIPKNQSSCLVTSKWDWHNTNAGGRWSGPYQVYRYKRPYVPTGLSDPYDTGESLIVTKSRLRGHGKALSTRFESEAGKDFQLLGYAIPYTTTVQP